MTPIIPPRNGHPRYECQNPSFVDAPPRARLQINSSQVERLKTHVGNQGPIKRQFRSLSAQLF